MYEKKKKTLYFILQRPITRSITGDHNNLVLETGVMGDQIKHQLEELVNLFQEERAANLARHEEINARLDALTQDLVNSKDGSDST